MDDPKNGEYTRPPEFKEMIDLCAALNREGAAYILIGGFAVILHGMVRGTTDIDFLVDDSPENAKKLKTALSSLPDNAIRQMGDEEIQKYSVVRIADEFVVDLLGKSCGITYDEAKKDIEWREVDGVRIPIPKKELLIKMKDTIRFKDKADAEYLRWRIEEEKKESKG